MKKKEFLEELKKHLKKLPKEEREDILLDYEEHFEIGMKKGRKESELAKSLGKPKDIAKQYKAKHLVKKAEAKKNAANITRAILATVGLGFLNVVFVLGPVLAVIGMLIGVFGAAIGITVGGIAVVIISICMPHVSPAIHMLNPVGTAFIGVGMFCFGILLFIGGIYALKLLYKVGIAYLKFNIKIIKPEESK